MAVKPHPNICFTFDGLSSWEEHASAYQVQGGEAFAPRQWEALPPWVTVQIEVI